ncbi:activating signal cointegrator 1 [Diabrotica virgifera virgifera]|uniref:Activating signal cointegrator 1 n=1 Tax=Diabrotica virgifera virgifera TaxID=50390 RepID=A0A6P7FYB6_DIAVI|nr:activating signal cointegrator 1 [Diabrotica virgifera virgifera]
MGDTAIINYLNVILGNDVSNDIVSYIKSIKSEDDYEEFMENIIDRSNLAHKNSYDGIRNIIFRKTAEKEKPEITNANKKGKKKFKDINVYQEKKKEKEGRQVCDCLGQEHDFMNNCMVCGRIHCIEEGPGPCLFCGNHITVRGEEVLNGRKQKSIMKPKENKVFDDDNDYFKVNSKKKDGKDDKRKMIVALDFASRKVIEGTKEDEKIRKRLLKESIEHLKKVEQMYKDIQKHSETSYQRNIVENANEDLVNLLIQMRHKKPPGKENLGEEDSSMPIIDYGTRIFDEDSIVNTDHGLCLSMHQPWASLLVAGVKKHEGRTWPTTHRGRLWIAAAAKVPEEEEIEALESFYRDYYQDPTLQFPKDYPTSCLLGCVFVEDCLDQEAYQKRFGNSDKSESNSPYVLICSNPMILPIFYPIVGKHKIYALDKDLHKCAKLALQHANLVL